MKIENSENIERKIVDVKNIKEAIDLAWHCKIKIGDIIILEGKKKLITDFADLFALGGGMVTLEYI